MNDITHYLSVRDQLHVGDVLVFHGTSPLSEGIEILSGGPSHSGIVTDTSSGCPDVVFCDSSRPIILNKKSQNGPASHLLGAELEGYDHNAGVTALILKPAIRASMNMSAFDDFISKCIGTVTYDVAGLFEFLLREVPILGVDEWQAEKSKVMYCSAFVIACLTKAGILHNINWSKSRPQDLVEFGIYERALPLMGNLKLKRFNSL